jgi:hypothetical protein
MSPEMLRRVEDLYRAARERGRDILDGADIDLGLRREVESRIAGDHAPSGVPDSLTGAQSSGATRVTAGSEFGPNPADPVFSGAK